MTKEEWLSNLYHDPAFPHLIVGWPRTAFYRKAEGHLRCKDCGYEEVETLSGSGTFDEDDFYTVCAECGSANTHLQIVDQEECGEDLGFSWSGCDCCGSNLGGDKFAVAAWNEDMTDYVPLRVCQDCLMFIANGELPDFLED